MYYDVNGDGKMEYLDTENNKERFTAWFALDGTVVERVERRDLVREPSGQPGLHGFGQRTEHGGHLAYRTDLRP